MHQDARLSGESNIVPLHSAVLCVACESVTICLSDECLVCGSHSLFNLERLLGGSQPSSAIAKSPSRSVPFDAQIDIDLEQINPREFSAIVEAIAEIIRSKQLAAKAQFRIKVEPAAEERGERVLKAA